MAIATIKIPINLLQEELRAAGWIRREELEEAERVALSLTRLAGPDDSTVAWSWEKLEQHFRDAARHFTQALERREHFEDWVGRLADELGDETEWSSANHRGVNALHLAEELNRELVSLRKVYKSAWQDSEWSGTGQASLPRLRFRQELVRHKREFRWTGRAGHTKSCAINHSPVDDCNCGALSEAPVPAAESDVNPRIRQLEAELRVAHERITNQKRALGGLDARFALDQDKIGELEAGLAATQHELGRAQEYARAREADLTALESRLSTPPEPRPTTERERAMDRLREAVARDRVTRDPDLSKYETGDMGGMQILQAHGRDIYAKPQTLAVWRAFDAIPPASGPAAPIASPPSERDAAIVAAAERYRQADGVPAVDDGALDALLFDLRQAVDRPKGAPPQAHDPGHPHLINGEFQSDKYPTCPRGKVPLSVKDTTAQDLLWEYAQRRRPVDAEFATDLQRALRTAGHDPRSSPTWKNRWATNELERLATGLGETFEDEAITETGDEPEPKNAVAMAFHFFDLLLQTRKDLGSVPAQVEAAERAAWTRALGRAASFADDAGYKGDGARLRRLLYEPASFT